MEEWRSVCDLQACATSLRCMFSGRFKPIVAAKPLHVWLWPSGAEKPCRTGKRWHMPRYALIRSLSLYCLLSWQSDKGETDDGRRLQWSRLYAVCGVDVCSDVFYGMRVFQYSPKSISSCTQRPWSRLGGVLTPVPMPTRRMSCPAGTADGSSRLAASTNSSRRVSACG